MVQLPNFNLTMPQTYSVFVPISVNSQGKLIMRVRMLIGGVVFGINEGKWSRLRTCPFRGTSSCCALLRRIGSGYPSTRLLPSRARSPFHRNCRKLGLCPKPRDFFQVWPKASKRWFSNQKPGKVCCEIRSFPFPFPMVCIGRERETDSETASCVWSLL